MGGCEKRSLRYTALRARARQALRTSSPWGVFAFWVGMLLAARGYPSEYDWRYMTISSLVYPQRNPDGYGWARAGIALCGLGGLYWAAWRLRARNRPGCEQSAAGMRALGLGYLSMTCCALLPERQLGLPRAHDLLALVAFIAICIGLVHATFQAAKLRATRHDPHAPHRARSAMVAFLVLSPILLAALSQAYVSHARPDLPWVGLTWRDRGIPLYLSFAFWEWVACVVFSMYVLALSACLPAAPGSASRSGTSGSAGPNPPGIC